MVKILIADDHELLRHGVRRLLEAQIDWEVVAEAVDGREAVSLAQKAQPDVAILDLSMPGLNGLAAAEQIVNCSPQTAILILTMHHSDQITREILASGARGYVLKSDAAEELVTAIQAVLAGRLAYPPHAQRVLAEACAQRGRRTGLLTDLSPREHDILCRLAAGSSNKEVAFDLGISMKTVETHRAHLMGKLSLNSLCELVHYAIRHELIDPWVASSPIVLTPMARVAAG
jgi:DNA-binding NarL/FixJ family response regulator